VLSLKDVGLEIPVFTTETRSLKASLVRSVTGGQLRRNGSGATVTALKNINCEINKGERVALIGHNGAGKTAFLKLVSGIYMPSTGFFATNIDVHPMIRKSFITSLELSGVQAIKAHFLMTKGSLSGFDQFCEEVVSFSGLGDFIRLPVKTYSEGMASRLLFAILTGLQYDCLAMDEGFGAGDSSFYEVAQRRLRDFIGNTGTLLLASHSEVLLRQFCRRGLVFSRGMIVFDGKLEEALAYYHESL
jgi:ABC-type polysaccharide/polyol phosphate transport system ATPase subunit